MNQSISEELGTMEKRFQKEFETARDYNLHWNEIEDIVRDFIRGEISQALTAERKKFMKRVRDEVTYCPEAYGFEGLETFPDCGKCIVCEVNALLEEK